MWPPALTLLVLVLGLMSGWANLAHAESTGGSWTYQNIGEMLHTFEGALSEPAIEAELEIGVTAILDAKVLGVLLEYRCKQLTVNQAKLKPGGEILGKLILHKCDTFLAGALSKTCIPNAGGTHPELIETGSIKAVMLLHKLPNGTVDKILIAEPDEANNDFAFVESTSACSIGLKVLIGGKFAIQDPAPTTHKVWHLFNEFSPLTHLFVLSDTPEHAAKIAGSAEAFLAGDHLSYLWAGLWK